MIEKMQRIFLYGLAGDSGRLMEGLMKAGCVQLTDPAQGADYEEIKDLVERGSADLYGKEQTLSRLGQCIALLGPLAPKKSLLARRREVDFGELGDGKVLEAAEAVWEKADALRREMGEQKSALSREEFLRASLEPWKELDLPLEVQGTRGCRVILAVLPEAVTLEGFGAAAEELAFCGREISAGRDQRYFAFAVWGGDEGALLELLRQLGGSQTAFPGLSGTAADNIAASLRRTGEAEAALEKLREEMKELARRLPEVQLAWDGVRVSLECARARQNLLLTGETFALEGWVPERLRPRVEKLLAGYTCAYEFRPAGEEEDPPVLLKNNRFVAPFEVITEMYALPSPHSIDPNPFMAPFFFVLFGMMLSDAGYGLILAAAGLWGAKHLDLGTGAKKLLTMLGYCGISTVFWGALYGSWFGDAIPKVASVFLGREVQVPMLIDPLSDPMPILILAFAVGYLHILLGMGLSAYLMIRRGHLWDAVFDVGFWYLILIGLPLLLAGGIAAEAGKWLAIAGAAGLVLTQGRDKKNPFLKLASGVLSLYNITGYVSDLLSYSRIMALGLATGVIGQVVNTMGTLPGRNIFGAVLFVAVFALGHLLNMAINALGSYVHTSRLQYVEFFGKFFEGGGEPFRPLSPGTKYVSVKSQEE